MYYSPPAFSALGLKAPTDWAQLLTLTEYLRAKNAQPPWCEGFASDASSGAAGEAFVDDMVLREDGTAVYDQWVSHQIPFSDPAIQKAFADVGEILQNKDWVNAGAGGVASINTTTTAQVATALESGKCLLTLQSSSFLDDLERTGDTASDVGPSAKIWAFILPPVTPGSNPYTVSGDFVAAFSNDADTVKVQNYLASAAWAKTRMSLGRSDQPRVIRHCLRQPRCAAERVGGADAGRHPELPPQRERPDAVRGRRGHLPLGDGQLDQRSLDEQGAGDDRRVLAEDQRLSPARTDASAGGRRRRLALG